MNSRLLLSILGWPSERSGCLGAARWAAPAEDGLSTVKASIVRNHSRLVARVDIDNAASGAREPLLFLSAKIEGADAAPLSATLGFPPEPADPVDCAKIFHQLSDGMGKASFLNGGPAPADALPMQAPWAGID